MSLLYLISASVIPEFESEPELLFVEADSEVRKRDEPIPSDQLEYVSTLVSNYEDPRVLEALVKKWWKSLCGVEPRLQLITASASTMSLDQVESLRNLGPDSWNIRNVFMAYRRDSLQAREEAEQFVVDSSTMRS